MQPLAFSTILTLYYVNNVGQLLALQHIGYGHRSSVHLQMFFKIESDFCTSGTHSVS